MRRLTGLLAVALILFGNLKGIAGSACAVHAAAQAAPAAAPADEHAGHAGHGQAATAPEQSDHHDSCTCLEHCQSCLTSGLAAVAPRLPQLAFSDSFVRAIPAPDTRAPSRAPHQLPFATAPPAWV